MGARHEPDAAPERPPPATAPKEKAPLTELLSTAPVGRSDLVQPAKLLVLQRLVGNAAAVRLLQSAQAQHNSPAARFVGMRAGTFIDGARRLAGTSPAHQEDIDRAPVLQRNCGPGHRGPPLPGRGGGAGKAVAAAAPVKKKSPAELAAEARDRAFRTPGLKASIQAEVLAAEAADIPLVEAETRLATAARLLKELTVLGVSEHDLSGPKAQVLRGTAAITKRRDVKTQADLSAKAAQAASKRAGLISAALPRVVDLVDGASAAEDAAMAATDVAGAEAAKRLAEEASVSAGNAQRNVAAAVITSEADIATAVTHQARSTAIVFCLENAKLGALITAANVALDTAKDAVTKIGTACALIPAYVDGATRAVTRKREDRLRLDAAKQNKVEASSTATADAKAAKGTAVLLQKAEEVLAAARQDPLPETVAELEKEYQAAVTVAQSNSERAASSATLLAAATRALAESETAVKFSGERLKSLKDKRELARIAAERELARISAGSPAAEPPGPGEFFQRADIEVLSPSHGADLMSWVGSARLDQLQQWMLGPAVAADHKHLLALLQECPKTAEGIDEAWALMKLTAGKPEYLDLVVRHGTFAKLAKLKELLGLATVTARDLAFYVDPKKGGQQPEGLYTDLSAGSKVWLGEDTTVPAFLPAGTSFATITADAGPSKKGAAPDGGKTYAGNRTFKNLGGALGMRLPTSQTYIEYDIKPFSAGNRGAERVIVDGRGWKYYTADHYTSMKRFSPMPAIKP